MLDNGYFNYCEECEDSEPQALVCDNCKDKFYDDDEYYYGDDGTMFCCIQCVLVYHNIEHAE